MLPEVYFSQLFGSIKTDDDGTDYDNDVSLIQNEKQEVKIDNLRL